SQPRLAHMTGYSVSQIQQCQYIAQSLGVLKVVYRSNKATGKQTTSMYIIIPQGLERFLVSPIAKEGETDCGDTTIVTGGHNDCVQTQNQTQISNPNCERQVGWIDGRISNTANTESLATL